MVPARPENRFFGRLGVGVGDDMASRIQGMIPIVQQAAMYAVMTAGEIIRRDAWGRANVSPGIIGNAVDGTHMRDNIQVRPQVERQGASCRIFIDLTIVPYAHHQEFNTRTGKPFMRPAMDENRTLVRDIMGQIIREALFGEAAGATDIKLFTRFYRGKP